MHELVSDEAAIAPTVGADENAVLESESAGLSGKEVDRSRGRAQHRMRRNGNVLDTQQAHAFRIPNTNCFRVRHLGFRKRYALAQDTPFLVRRPLRG